MTLKINQGGIVSPRRPDLLIMISLDSATNQVQFSTSKPIPVAQAATILAGLLADFNSKLFEASMKSEVKFIPATTDPDKICDNIATIIDGVSTMLDHLDDKLVQKFGKPEDLGGNHAS